MGTRAGIAYIDVRLGDFTKFTSQLKARVTAAGDESAREFGNSFAKKLATDKGQFDGLTNGLRAAVRDSGQSVDQLRVRLREAGKGGADGFLREFSPLLRRGISSASIDAKDRLLEAFDTNTISPRLASTLRASLTEALDSGVTPALARTGATGRSAFAGLADAARSFGTRIGLLGYQITNLGFMMTIAFTAPVAALGGLGAALGLKLASQLETAQASFTALLGSAEAAKVFLADLRKFAQESPLFDTQSVIEFSRKLLAVGVPASEMKDTIKALSGVTAYYGLTVDQTASVVKALGDAMRKGTVYAEELNQFGDAGIDIYGILGQALGKTRQEIQAMIKAQTLTSQDLFDAIKKVGTSKEYLLALEGQTKSLAGVWSQFKETLSNRLADAVTPQLDKIKDSLKSIGDSLGSIIENSGPFFANLVLGVEKFAKMLDSLAKAYARLTPDQQAFVTKLILILSFVGPAVVVIGSLVTSIGAIASALGFLAGPAGAVILLIAEFGAAIVVAYNKSKPFRDFLKNDLWPVLREIGGIVGGVFKSLKDAIVENFGDIDLSKVFSGALEIGRTFLAWVKTDVIPELKKLARHFEEEVKPAIKKVADTLKDDLIPKLEEFVQFLKDHKEELRIFWGILKDIALILAYIALIVGAFLLPTLDTLLSTLSGTIFVLGSLAGSLFLEIDIIKTLWGWLGNLDDAWSNMWRKVAQGASDTYEAIRRFLEQARDFLVNAVPGMFASVGRAIVDGIVSGIKAVAHRIGTAAADAARSAYDAVMNAIGARSPSRLTMRIGVAFGQGMALGIDQTQPLVRGSAVALAGVGASSLTGFGNSRIQPASSQIVVRVGEKQVTDIVVDAARRRAQDMSGIVDLGASRRQRRG